MAILPNTSRINIIPWNHKVCFLSMARDESTWIEGPTLQETNVTTWSHLRIPLKEQAKRPHTKGEAPLVIGGSADHPLSPIDLQHMEACKEAHQGLILALDSMAVSSKGYENVIMGPHKTTINTPYPLTLILVTKEEPLSL